jgi:succinate dehydrogenase / fumarate reductase cytochrome b subunit
MAPSSRPLSPHLFIYKFTITMAMSIMHRATGIALYAATLLLVIWLGAAALGDGPLGVVDFVYGSWLGQIVLFLLTWVLFHHMLGGLRHFTWDTIHGLEPGVRQQLAWANLIGSIVLTLLAWAVFVWFRG